MQSDFTFRKVEPDEIAAVRQLRKEVYNAALGTNPDDGYDSRAYHYAAYRSDGSLVGAFRVIGADLRPFEFEPHFPLTDLIAAGRVPAMVGKLCISSRYRRVSSSMMILLGLLRCLREHAMRTNTTDYFLMALPHLVQMYERAGFKNVGITFVHVDWGQLELMRLSL